MAQTYTNQKGIKSALGNPPDKGHSEYKDTTTTGLYLRVYSTGLASFIHRYKVKGQRRVYTLPDIELKKGHTEKAISTAITEARAIHAGQRVKVKAKKDPAIERDLKMKEMEAMPTVKTFFDTYMKMYAIPSKGNKGKKSWQEDGRQLKADVIPAIGLLPLDEVQRTQINAMLNKKQSAGHATARDRLKAVLSKFFNFAISQGYIENNPASGIDLIADRAGRSRFLSDDEIRFFWQETNEDSHLSPSTRLALRMILITAQRPGEVRQMHESQIDGNMWHMKDTKNGRPHSVPLSELALKTLEEARPHIRNGLFFAGLKGGAIGINTLPRAMKRMDWQGEAATAHDLRRTATTNFGEMEIERSIQNMVTNHVDNTIAAVYDRHDYIKQKRQALDAWARKLNQIVTGQVESNVVQLRSA